MFKTKEALIPYLLLVAAMAGGLIWHESENVPRLGRTVTQGQVEVGGPFTLTNQDGKPTSSTDFRGKYQLIYFGYSFCPDVCPTDAQAIGAGLRRFAERDPYRAARVVPIFVPIDPARDTPAVLGRFVAAFHPRMVGLTGSADAVARAEKAFAVYAKRGETTAGGGYMMDHSRQAYLMDPDNKPVALIPADEGPTAVADALARWVK